MGSLKKRIGDLAYYVTQKQDTERPYTGEYNNHFPKTGFYSCIVYD